ncbi:type IV pilin protein [Aquabacterium sp. A08]|uniref:type IV pilin protein n=1 Tax=Aquabacterium sp. A08 TaxID=2718532 RepID=UPI00142167D9|nr:type IV pilin protein [Aquabacterium sp. A08]NIC41499.1 type IV pilin protein [Aquabacterium sp. A08]
MSKYTKGFTLIELMIVVAILAILSSIAYPAYMRYLVQARRAEAQAFMHELALRQERFRANNPLYGATNAAGINANVDTLDFYNFDVQNATATGFTIRGIAQLDQANRDAACTPLTLTRDGTRGPAGCWRD